MIRTKLTVGRYAVALAILFSSPVMARDFKLTEKRIEVGSLKVDQLYGIDRDDLPKLGRDKPIFIEFAGAEKLAEIAKDGLRARGYTIAANKEEAAIRLKMGGGFKISGNGKEVVQATIPDFMSAASKATPSTSSDYTHQNVAVSHIGVAAAVTGALSVSMSLTWVTQKLGIAGRFNEMISGDPRGFCLHENCKKYHTGVVIWAEGDVSVMANSRAWNEAVIVDQMLAQAMQRLIDQFPVATAQVSSAAVVGE